MQLQLYNYELPNKPLKNHTQRHQIFKWNFCSDLLHISPCCLVGLCCWLKILGLFSAEMGTSKIQVTRLPEHLLRRPFRTSVPIKPYCASLAPCAEDFRNKGLSGGAEAARIYVWGHASDTAQGLSSKSDFQPGGRHEYCCMSRHNCGRCSAHDS